MPKYFRYVLLPNSGSPYGSTCPRSINPQTNKIYGSSFPLLSIRDVVNTQNLLLESLNISKINTVVGIYCLNLGGSLGGMQTLEWLLSYSKKVQRAIVLSCGSYHTSWQIGISEAQRQAIYKDPKYLNGDYLDSEKPINVKIFY